MFGEGVLATDAFATFLCLPPVANCGVGKLFFGGGFRNNGELRRWRTRGGEFEKSEIEALSFCFQKKAIKSPSAKTYPKTQREWLRTEEGRRCMKRVFLEERRVLKRNCVLSWVLIQQNPRKGVSTEEKRSGMKGIISEE